MKTETLITTVIVITGWLIAHLLTQHRERTKKRQDKRVEYLITAYRNLEASANCDSTPEIDKRIESAIADIHLFGNEKQIELAIIFSNAMANTGPASLDDLLLQLREDLRKELKLSKVPRKLNYLRINVKKK